MQRQSGSTSYSLISVAAQKYSHFVTKSPGPYFSPIDPHLRHYYQRKQLKSAPCSSRTRGNDSSNANDSLSLRRPLSSAPQSSYVVIVKTCDHPTAGTDAKVYITLHGDQGNLVKKRLARGSRRKGHPSGTFKFEPGSVEKFRIRGPLIGDLVCVDVENCGRREGQGWWLDTITVKEAASGKKWLFPCNKWLSLHHGDCRTERTLLPKQNEDPDHQYTLQLCTGNVRGAGTDANIFVTLTGKKATTARTHVTGCKFTSGSTETFVMITKDVGELKSLTVEHDNMGFGPSWFLDKVTVTDHTSNQAVVFPCGVWLARDEGDGEIKRVLHPSHTSPPPPSPSHTYLVTTVTGDMKGAGTDSSVFISLQGDTAASGEWRLENSKDNFERGRKDTFCLKTTDLGDLRHVTIRHDNRGTSPSWYLVHVEVQDERGVVYHFPCNQWLSRGEGDGCIERTLTLGGGAEQIESTGPTSQQYKYVLQVRTGDQAGSTGTANAYVTLHGGGRGTERALLDKRHLQRGHTHKCEVLSSVLVDHIDKICVGHDSPGHATSWYLENIEVEVCPGGQKVTFPGQGWLRSEDGKVERELRLATPTPNNLWTVCIWTSDLLGAGTDANVFLQVFGEGGRGSKKTLLGSSVESFERGQMDTFEIALEGLGTPKKVMIGHDNTGPYPDWHLEKVELVSMATGERYLCLCGRWLSAGGGGTVAELEAILIQGSLPMRGCVLPHDPKDTLEEYEEYGDFEEAILDSDEYAEANVSITLDSPHTEGEANVSITLDSPHTEGEANVSITPDSPHTEGEANVSITPDSPHTEGEANASITPDSPHTEGEHCETEKHHCSGSERSHTQSSHSEVSQNVTYTLHTTVTCRSVPHSCAHLMVILIGEQVTSDPIPLKLLCSRSGDLATTETFSVTSRDVGVVKGLRVWLEGSTQGERWMVAEVCLACPNSEEVVHFPCGRWVEMPPQELRPADPLGSTTGATTTTSGPGDQPTTASSLIAYEVKVTTADKKHLGYPQKVLLVLVGEKGTSHPFEFKNSSHAPKFQRGQTDTFNVGCKNIGPLKAVRVAHCPRRKANTSPGHHVVNWYLFEVCLTRLIDKQKFHFLCRKWLAESSGEEVNFTEIALQQT